MAPAAALVTGAEPSAEPGAEIIVEPEAPSLLTLSLPILKKPRTFLRCSNLRKFKCMPSFYNVLTSGHLVFRTGLRFGIILSICSNILFGTY